MFSHKAPLLRRGIGLALLGYYSGSAVIAQAQLPGGMDVIHGEVSAQQMGQTLQLNQLSAQAITEWQNFDIGRDFSVLLQQPDALSTMLARVTSGNPSAIHGQLQANGQLFLVNPNGILVGEHGQINTAGFLASSLALSDEHFLRHNDMLFSALQNSGAVVNLGSIIVDGGYAVLVGVQVHNAMEQFMAGGFYSVRGYFEGLIIGDHAANLRQEWQYHRLPSPASWVNGTSLYLFHDMAQVRNAQPLPDERSFSIQGAGLGARWMQGPLALDMAYGWPLNRPAGLPVDSRGRFHMNLRLAY